MSGCDNSTHLLATPWLVYYPSFKLPQCENKAWNKLWKETRLPQFISEISNEVETDLPVFPFCNIYRHG